MTKASATHFTYQTPHGPATFSATDKGICHVEFASASLDGAKRATELTNKAATQLQEYLAGKRRVFDVPLDMQGSAFQKMVWTEVCAIPYGETRTAADIAEALGKPGSHRSVGTAIRQCTLAPFVPVHRIPVANATGKRAKIFRAFQALEQRS